jgi:signal peptidase complex subunit 2
LGLLTCATALLAQFYPVPFPRNYWLLVACVLSYFTLNTLLQAFCYYVERDTILLTKGKEGAPRTGRGLKLSSSLPRYSDQYTLSLQARGASADSKPHELSKSVAAWIYEDGELDQSGFGAEVLRLLSQCEAGRTKRD